MTIQQLANQVIDALSPEMASDGDVVQPVPGLILLRHTLPTEKKATLYEPVVCLIVQGRKEATFGRTSLTLGPGESMVVSHDLPVVSRITSAVPDEPYLAVIVTIDLQILRSLYEEMGGAVVDHEPVRAFAIHDTDPRLVDALSRYLSLADDPTEASVMSPLIRREIHLRLLRAPHGGMLRRLLRHDSHASAISRAIARIRRDFRTRIVMPELAEELGMSTSSFFRHFRQVTSTTPLQYQKELRLLEARSLLANGGQSVSSVAYEVGYESPNQFSREYSRKYGMPPREDLDAALELRSDA